MKKIFIRIDEELWKELKNCAKLESRSLNNLMEYLLLKIIKQEKEKNLILK